MMPLPSSATDVVGIVTLVLVILCCAAGALCLLFVFLFHTKLGKERQLPLRDFDSPWLVRIVLVGLFVLWSLGELLRLPWMRMGDGFLHNMDWKTQADLCRLHVVWSVGIMEPGFLLTAFFLVRGSLLVSSSASKYFNGRVLTQMGFCCLPVFILQLLLVVLSHNDNKEGVRGSIPPYFTKSFQLMSDDANIQRALCTCPLFSILLLGLFSSFFVIFFSCLGMRMLHHVINRRLQMRVCWLVLAVMLFLPLHVLFLGFSVRSEPTETKHEVLLFLGFLTLLVCGTGGIGVLVVLPVADALAVHSSLKNRDQRWQSCCSIPLEPLGSFISAVVSDDEEAIHDVESQSLLGAVSNTGADASSSSRDGSFIFDTLQKDLTLGPGGWLGDSPVSLTSPSY